MLCSPSCVTLIQWVRYVAPAHTPGTAGAPQLPSAGYESYSRWLTAVLLVVAALLWMFRTVTSTARTGNSPLQVAGAQDTEQSRMQLKEEACVLCPSSSTWHLWSRWAVHSSWNAVRRTRRSKPDTRYMNRFFTGP